MVRKAGRRSWNPYRSGPLVDHTPPLTNLEIDKRRLSTHDQLGMILSALLLFFGASAILMWAGQRNVPAGPAPAAIAEAVWILVTCGPKRAARPPAVCALLSVALLAWIAVT